MVRGIAIGQEATLGAHCGWGMEGLEARDGSLWYVQGATDVDAGPQPGNNSL